MGAGQDPADGGEVHARVMLAECREPPGQRLDRGLGRHADGEVVEPRRAGALIAIAWQTEPAEPDIAAAGRAGREATRDAARLFCTRLRDDGLVPASCDITWLADSASLVSQAQTWLLGRDTLGWTGDQYSQWLSTTLTHLITAAGPSFEENDRSA